LVAAALPATLPFARFLDAPAESDALALIPVWWLKEGIVRLSAVPIVVGLTAVILAAAFVVVGPRFAYVLPALVLAWFVFANERLEDFNHGFPKASVGALFQGMTNADRDWVDSAVGRHADVSFVWSGENHNARAFQLWENEFFNRSVRRVYYLHLPSPGELPEQRLREEQSGTLTL